MFKISFSNIFIMGANFAGLCENVNNFSKDGIFTSNTIENRRDFIRVANTGISAIINAKGMVIARTPWWEKATLKGKFNFTGDKLFLPAMEITWVGYHCYLAAF